MYIVIESEDGSEVISESIINEAISLDEAQAEWRLLKMTIDDKRLFTELLQEYNSPDWQKHRFEAYVVRFVPPVLLVI